MEYEYPIPIDDAREILDAVASRPLIDKTRHLVRRGSHTWEIDEFHGDNAGLVVAEIELEDADEAFERPSWLGDEVSTDPRYYNSNLSRHPYTAWTDGE
jgi:adenylate cyclase